jgi:hypothetical protein
VNLSFKTLLLTGVLIPGMVLAQIPTTGVQSSNQLVYTMPTDNIVVPKVQVIVMPSTRNGQGNTIIPASTSTAINASISKTANSGPFPTGWLQGALTIKNESTSTNVAYICWQGGTCSAAIGEPLAVGEGVTESLPTQNMTTQPPTVYTAGATLTLKW